MKTWTKATLGDVCDIINGRNQKDVLDENGIYPIYGSAGNLMGLSKKYICEAGTVIIGRKGNISKPLFINEKFWNVDTAFGIYPKNSTLLPKFNYYQCLNIDFASRNKGTTIPSLVKTDLQTIPVSYPPDLSVQQQIVEKLDAAFEGIDRAKANLEKNIQNAKELFQSKLNEVFSGKSKDFNYEKKKFKDICVLQRGFDLPTRLRKQGDFPLVSSNGITDYISEYKVTAPAVVTGRSGTIGKVHYIEKDLWPLNTALYIKDFKGNLEKFIYYFLLASNLEKFASGAGVPTLNRNFIHDEIFVTTSNLEEQQKIVSQLDELLTQTQTMQNKYAQKLAALEELRKSILAKAFKGELI